MYKLIFFDLDGTLLNDQKEILEENITEFKRLKELGIHTVLCSGRQINSLKHYQIISNSSQFIIATNGAEIYDTKNDRELFLCNILKKDILDLYSLAQKLNLVFKIDTTSARYVSNTKYASKEEIEYKNNINQLLNTEKILQISLGHQSKILIKNVISKVSKNPNIRVANIFQFNKEKKENTIWFINIVNSLVSKGNSIKELCKILNVEKENTMAFGDDINDISMLNSVGYGIAMGNSNTSLREFANEIISDNNTPGIATILKRIT